jgi:hypothetical protein
MGETVKAFFGAEAERRKHLLDTAVNLLVFFQGAENEMVTTALANLTPTEEKRARRIARDLVRRQSAIRYTPPIGA